MTMPSKCPGCDSFTPGQHYAPCTRFVTGDTMLYTPAPAWETPIENIKRRYGEGLMVQHDAFYELMVTGIPMDEAEQMMEDWRLGWIVENQQNRLRDARL